LKLFLTGSCIYSRIDDHSYFIFFSKCIAIVLQNNQTEQEIYVIFGIILYKYNNSIDKYLLWKNAWKVDDQRLMFVLKIWVYRHDLNKYLSCDENIIINLITLQWIIFSGTKLLGPIFSWVFKGAVKITPTHQNLDMGEQRILFSARNNGY
jgi:hypothetical protein